MMDNIEAIIVRADLSGNLSEASQAAVRDLARLEEAAAKAQRSTTGVGEGAERASQGFAALEARLDGNVRVTNAKAAADARLAREIETITRNTEANSAAQARANALIEAATRNRDAYIARVRQDVAATEQRTARVLGESAAITQFSAANDNAAQSSGRMRAALSQAGFQVQDFATQVSMGQNALMAFGVQGAQLAGALGPTGAIAGAALMIGVIGAQLLGMGESASQAEAKIRTAFDGIKAESEGVRDLVKEIGDLFKTAAERAGDLARAQRGVLAQNADLRLSNAIQLQDAAATRIPTLEREIAVLERRAAVEQDIARRAGRGGQTPVDQTTDLTSALFVARSQLAGMRSEMDLQSRRIGEINTARTRLEQAGSDQGYGQYGPEAPRAERTRASAESASAAMREYQAIMREAEGQVARTLSEEERRNAVLDRLAVLLANGDISGAQYVAGMEAQARAAEAVREQEAQRATARAEAEATRAGEAAQRQSSQAANAIESNFTGAFTRAFEAGENAGKSFLTSIKNGVKSLATSIASQLIFRMAVVPVVNAGASALGYAGNVLGSPNSPIGGVNLGGLFGGQAQAATPGAEQGGISGAGSSFGTLRQAYNGLTSPGGLGSFFPGGAPVNTRFESVNGVLNTSLVSPSFGPVGGFPDAAGFQSLVDGTSNIGNFPSAAGFQSIVDGTATVGASASSGLTVASALGPAASIAGGAYGIYSGIQKGGVGGALGAAGGAVSAATGIGMLGAAAGLLPALGVLGPIGLGIGAALAIAGALMPGEKASGGGQLAHMQVDSNEISFGGLGGNRFSQANQDNSANSARRITDLAREIGGKLGGAQFGGSVSVGTTTARRGEAATLYLEVGDSKKQFANNESGAKELGETAASFILKHLREKERTSGDYKGILDASGDNLDKLNENLNFYEGAYKTLSKTTEEAQAATNQYAVALAAAAKPYDDAIAKARELSLAEGALVTERDKAVALVEKQRDLTLRGIDAELAARGGSLGGTGFLAIQREQAAIAATTALDGLRTSLQALGLTTEEVALRVGQLSAIQADETGAAERGRVVKLSDYIGSLAAAAQGDTKGGERIALAASFRDQNVQANTELRTLGATAEETATALAYLHDAQVRAADLFENGIKEVAAALEDTSAGLAAANDNNMALARFGIMTIERLRAEVDAAYLGPNSPLTGQQRFGLAQGQFDKGTLDLNSYLSEAKGIFGTATSEYAGVFYGALDKQTAAAQDLTNAMRFNAIIAGGGNPNDDWYLNNFERETAPRPQGMVQGTDAVALATLMRDMIAELRSGNSVRVTSGETQIELTARMVRLLAALEGKSQLAAAA